MIEGTVRRATGEVFTFRDPCLLTVEALELGSWLKEAAAGLIAPSPQHNERDLLVFLEPNIAFSVEAWNLEEVVMRVHLSLEASPPWAEPDTELFDTIERLRLSPADVHVGADAWLAELAAFPLR
ncbi:hypothetical protein BCF74_13123 [Knoellia remsis]|uniref:Uncharacterized protein n=2 Tax=Knoellia remsis TaxID=407159 RepID=A0A2T0U4M3_9MICO|nr:hypothetical protein BCF74_13123 [Knoellia remsis]